MNGAWRLVLDQDAFEFLLRQSARNRNLIIKSLNLLTNDPGRLPDFELADKTGRVLSVRQAKPFLITYWLDASIKEIRIVDLELVASC